MPSKLRDMLRAENDDATRAASFAAHGRSMTGLSGRHTETDRLFGSAGAGAPIVGERVAPMSVLRMGTPVAEMVAGDPLFRDRRIEPANRQPFGAQEQTLAVAVREGYRRYWFSDVPGRVARAKRAGYEHVIDPDTGEPWSRVTDKDGTRGRSSFLMEIPITWYQDDMGRQAKQLADRLDDIRFGRAGPGASDHRYIPQQGIQIQGR
jgi:hypothetical protein